MIYIETDKTNRVVYINYKGKDLGKGYMIDSIPEPEQIDGKIPVMYYRDGQIVYEYVDTPEVPKPEVSLEEVKSAKIAEIDAYDTSANVNQFFLNGEPCWLDRDTRVSLMNSTTITKAAGEPNTTLWLNGKALTIPCDTAIGLLGKLEMYALACYNKTAEHKANVSKLKDVEAVKAYDITKGYPEKLQLNF